MTFGDAGSSTPMVLDNRIRAVAVTSKNRSKLLPDVPSIAESGYPGFEAVAWHGILAPAKTPPTIVKKLNQEIAKALKDPELSQRFAKDGLEIVASTPEEFSSYIKSEVDKWAKVVRESNIKID